MDISKEIKEAIKKNLPAEVGGTLGELLKEAEEALKELKRVKIINKQPEVALEGLQEQVEEVDEIARQHKLLDEREKEFSVRSVELRTQELRLDTTHAELRALEAERRSEALMELARIVFKNPVYVKSAVEKAKDPFGGGAANDTEGRPIPDKETFETETIE